MKGKNIKGSILETKEQVLRKNITAIFVFTQLSCSPNPKNIILKKASLTSS